MVNCPVCRAEQNETSPHCSECGAALDHEYAATVTQGAVPQPKGESSTTGSDDSHHGRFLPGATVAHRYRIVSMVGRGGMGEVYRADDLKLGQTVALKFLPKDFGNEPSRQEYFHREVRLTRQISHPNVCRVYDIADFEGQQFLSMEYIDGEDLSVLLRRIGRLPPVKSLQIARQLCAGLAAAHDRGVLHRDLKPANIMIDGRGHARIADFGLARLAGAAPIGEVVGTPAYMAPEQWLRGEATIQSDLFALGLILAELYTGEPVRQSRLIPNEPNAYESSVSQSIAWGKEVDTTVQRAIDHCLEPEPHARPASARAVAAALPGGDPLAAAIEAGETPSPEMVATSGDRGRLSFWSAGICLSVVMFGLLILAVFLARKSPTKDVHWPAFYKYRFESNKTLQKLVLQQDLEVGFEQINVADETTGDERTRIDAWIRSGPNRLVPFLKPTQATGRHLPGIVNPPPLDPGMVTLRMHPNGELRELLIVREPRKDNDPEKEHVTGRDWDESDWENDEELLDLLTAAGLSPDTTESWTDCFRKVPTGDWKPPLAHDDGGLLKLTPAKKDNPTPKIACVNAARCDGEIVFFHVVDADSPEPITYASVKIEGDWKLGQVFYILFALLAILFGWKNLRAGRSDSKGALRFALLVFLIRYFESMFGSPWAADLQMLGFRQAIAAAAFMWIYYIALEPLARRYWPEILVTWSRALTGRVQDPGVGRDLLAGMTIGVVYTVIVYVFLDVPQAQNPQILVGVQQPISQLGRGLGYVLSHSLKLAVVMVLVRAVVRNKWLPVIVCTGLLFNWHSWRFDPLFSLFDGDSDTGHWKQIEDWKLLFDGPAQYMLALIAYYGVVGLVLARWGVLVAASFMLCHDFFRFYPWSNDLSGPDVPGCLFAMAMILICAIYGFYTSVGGKTAFVAGTSLRE